MTSRVLLKKLIKARSRHRAGQHEAADRMYAELLSKDPGIAEAWHLRGVVSFQNYQYDMAEQHIRQALALSPGEPAILANLAAVLLATNRAAEAEHVSRQVLEAHPWHAEAVKHLSAALHKQGRIDEALQLASTAALKFPEDPRSLSQLGALLSVVGRLDDAHSTLLRARSLNAGIPQIHLNLSSVQRQLGQHDQALLSLDAAYKLDPRLVEQYTNRGNLLLETGKPEEAMAEFQRMLEHDPTSAPGLNGLGLALQLMGHWPEALEAFRLAAGQDEVGRGYDSNFLYCATLSPSVTRSQVAALHLAWGNSIAASTPVRRHPPGDHPDRILRIGYVSADYRYHATMKFFLPLLREHDHSKYKITLYSTATRADDVTHQVRAFADQWRICHTMPPEQLQEVIAADGIDILVDLAGHTDGNRLRVFATKPAPVQVSFMGYPNTTGLQTVDYRLTDSIRESAASAAYFAEQLISMPRGACCFELTDQTPEITDPPCRRNGYPTLGSTHRIEKISTDCLRLWARVMEALPDARLLVFRDVLGSSPAVRKSLLQRMQGVGIPLERIQMDWDCADSYLHVYSKIDILLDVFPWGGSTTAFEAMWMGVPSPAIRCPEQVSAVVASMLHFSGHGELVADDADTYVGLVSALARDPLRLQRLRTQIRPAMQSSVCSAAQFARDVESLYRAMWHRHCGRAVDLPTISGLTDESAATQPGAPQ